MPRPDHFYRALPKRATSLATLFADPDAFVALPDDWAVVMLDVAGSTQAVAMGLHHEVNLAATGGIVAVLNALRARDPGVKAPYFFGGDGATFLLPEAHLDEALDVLDRYQKHVFRTLNLTLKVGAHSVRGARAEGHDIRIAKWSVNGALTLPVVVGTGVKYAERVIKETMVDLEAAAVESILSLDLGGMECRWDEVLPPRDGHRVACLIVDSPDDARQGHVYADAARLIDEVFGGHDERHPISGQRLKLDFAIAKTQQELRVRIGRYRVIELLRAWFVTLVGPLYFRYSAPGRAYLTSVVDLSHTLMLDGTFNVVLSGTAEQMDTLRRRLAARESAGELRYGLHVTHASLMSCYVVDRELDHAHFVDGTEGGFTSAARELKGKG